jgi:predicted dienelactone hydrolase
MAAMQKAASAENSQLRTQDIPAVLNQLELWNQAFGNELHGRMNAEHLGMSGHSFGAVTSQAISGQWTGNAKRVSSMRFQPHSADAYLLDSKDAKAWLDEEARSVLEKRTVGRKNSPHNPIDFTRVLP